MPTVGGTFIGWDPRMFKKEKVSLVQLLLFSS